MKQLAIIIFFSLLVFSCINTSHPKEKPYGWVNDSLNLNREGLRQSGRWIDTTNTDFAFALYQSDSLNIMRCLILKTKGIMDIPVTISEQNDSQIIIKPIDSLELNGEYYIVKQGMLWLYNMDNRNYSTANKLLSTY